MSVGQVTSGVATAAGLASIPGLVGSAAELKQASGRQLGSDTKPQERVAETTSPEANTPAVEATPAPAAATPAAAPAETPKFSPEVLKAAETFGVDISGFADDANAQFAIQQEINRAVALGARPIEQPQAQVPTEEEEGDDEIDFSAISDPKVAAYVRKQQELANSAVQYVEQLRQEQLREQQAKAKEMYDSFVDRARKTIDSFQSADFGVGTQITVAQQLQRRNLTEVAANIIQGQRLNGRTIEIEDAMKAALTILGKTPGQAPAPAGKTLPPGSAGSGGKPAPARPYFGKARPAWDLTGVASDPNMQRGLGEIFAK